MAFISFPPRHPSSSARLPLTLIALDDWALSTITGVDSEKYIQGQVTADVSQMTEQQHLLAAHCDAKGKMWSTLRLFRERDGFAWIERRSVREAQLTELKKYAVFSKVVIAPDDERVLLGVAGFQARAALANVFSVLPNSENQVVRDGASTLLWFEHPAERFLLVTDVATANMLTEKLHGEAELNNSQQWLALDIEAGIPVIDAANSGQFIPRRLTYRRWAASASRKAATPDRRWSHGQNSAAPINARFGCWRAKPAGYRKQEKIWSYRWARTGVVPALFWRRRS